MTAQITIAKRYSRSTVVNEIKLTTKDNFVRFGNSAHYNIAYARFLKWDDILDSKKFYSDDMDTAYVHYEFKDPQHPFLSYLNNKGTIVFQEKRYDFPDLPAVNASEIADMTYYPAYNFQNETIYNVLLILENEEYVDIPNKPFHPPINNKRGPCEYVLYKNMVYTEVEYSKIIYKMDSFSIIAEYIKPPEARRILNLPG